MVNDASVQDFAVFGFDAYMHKTKKLTSELWTGIATEDILRLSCNTGWCFLPEPQTFGWGLKKSRVRTSKNFNKNRKPITVTVLTKNSRLLDTRPHCRRDPSSKQILPPPPKGGTCSWPHRWPGVVAQSSGSRYFLRLTVTRSTHPCKEKVWGLARTYKSAGFLQHIRG